MQAVDLLEWRRSLSWIQRQAAAALAVTVQHYADLERGRTRIRPAVAKLARFIAVEETGRAEAERLYPNVTT